MRLLRRADFNAGANVNTFWRMPCRGALDAVSKKSLTWDNKQITWFGMALWLCLSVPLFLVLYRQRSWNMADLLSKTVQPWAGLPLYTEPKKLECAFTHHAGV